MSFDHLPPQTPINPRADAYAARSLELSRQTVAGANCALHVPYGEDYWQRLDIFMPEKRSAAGDPVLMFFHGGGFTHGYKEWCDFMAPAFTSLPAVFVSVSYRLIPAVTYPGNVEDAFASLKWVRDNIAAYGGDPGRIFAGGHSAGANLVALMALRRDWREKAGLPDDALRAVFPISGVFRMRLGEQFGRPAIAGPDAPIDFAGNAAIPFYMIWGGQEREEFRESGNAMAAALKPTGITVEAEEFTECDHFNIHLNTGSADDRWTRKVRDWMARL